jgi:hypothetical protein
MAEKRSVSENHGDFEYTVEGDYTKVVSYRKPIDAKDTDEEPVKFDDLPSESLKDEYRILHSATA